MKSDLSITYLDDYHNASVGQAAGGGGMTLGALLKSKRTAEGWTQEEIAARAGRYAGRDVDQTHVSHWERDGIKRPTGDQLRMLASAYELPLVELVIGAGYLTRADLSEEIAPPNPPDDLIALTRQIATLTVRLVQAAEAQRVPESPSRTEAEGS